MSDILAAVDKIPYHFGKTNTAGALKQMRTQMFTSDNGDRADVPNYAIVLTGISSHYSLNLRFQNFRCSDHWSVENNHKYVSRYVQVISSEILPFVLPFTDCGAQWNIHLLCQQICLFFLVEIPLLISSFISILFKFYLKKYLINFRNNIQL